MSAHEGESSATTCETDRSRFVGRGGNLVHPAAMASTAPLSNSAGSVLDPAIALRRTVTIPPNGTAIIDLVTGMTENRERAHALVENVDEVYQELTDRGAKILSPIKSQHWGIREFSVITPDGHRIVFGQLISERVQ